MLKLPEWVIFGGSLIPAHLISPQMAVRPSEKKEWCQLHLTVSKHTLYECYFIKEINKDMLYFHMCKNSQVTMFCPNDLHSTVGKLFFFCYIRLRCIS